MKRLSFSGGACDWTDLPDALRREGPYHVETY